MDQNTEIHTVNTGIDMTKKYGNFTFEDILDGMFSQEKWILGRQLIGT